MSDEKKVPALLDNSKVQLDGAWGYQAQLNALKSCNAADDLTFKEKSVKDVTDRGRQEGASRLQKALEIALSSAPSSSSSGKALALTAGPREAADEADVRREVIANLKTLQRLRGDVPSTNRNTAALHVMRQLSDLDVSVGCLKATKVAAELNQPFWRGTEVSADVRRFATSLVKEWRVMFRNETGTTEVAMNPEVRSRKCRTISMDLEESAYGWCQKVAKYMEIVDWTCKIILGDGEVSKALLAGTLGCKELLTRAAEEVKRQRARLKHGIKG